MHHVQIIERPQMLIASKIALGKKYCQSKQMGADFFLQCNKYFLASHRCIMFRSSMPLLLLLLLPLGIRTEKVVNPSKQST